MTNNDTTGVDLELFIVTLTKYGPIIPEHKQDLKTWVLIAP